MASRPDLPKKLAARVRGAQDKVMSARGWIEALEFNTVQAQARWDEYSQNPEAFARRYYPGYGIDSYPVQTNTDRIREKLNDLAGKRERNRIELETAQAGLDAVEADVLAEVQRMRPTEGRVPWPSQLETHGAFMRRVMVEAYQERDEAPARRDAYIAEIGRQYNEEMVALEIARQAELDEMREDMKTWTEAGRILFVVVPATKPAPEVREETAIDVLVDAGFTLLGSWLVTDNGISLSNPAPKDPGVYAFVADGIVRYVGLTKTGFNRRMYNYSKPGSTQRTSLRINAIIADHAAAGTVVEIYIAIPPALEWNGLPIHTAAGLEAGLIEMIQPAWNKMGVS